MNNIDNNIDNVVNAHREAYDTLVISGGSTSGLVMLGRLYKNDLGIDIDKIKNFAGTSVGSIICLLLLLGFSYFEIANHLYHSNIWTKLCRIDPYRIVMGKGCFSLNIIRLELEGMIRDRLGKVPIMSELPKNFLCATFDLDKNELIYIDNKSMPDMDVVQAVIMSCSIPLLFEPCIYKGSCYIDGGILDNFPILKTCQTFDCKKVFGIRCLKTRVEKQDGTIWQLRDIVRILFACSHNNLNNQLSQLGDRPVHIETVSSSTLFFDLSMTKDRLVEMFLSGMLSNN